MPKVTSNTSIRDGRISNSETSGQFHTKDRYRNILSKNTLFSKPVLINRFNDRIEFIEYTSISESKPVKFSVHSINKNGSTSYQKKIRADLLPFGTIELDEDDSSEGKLVFYYEDAIV